MNINSHSYTQASKHACKTIQQPLSFFWLHLQPRCALYSEVLLNAGCFAFPLRGTCEAFLRAVRLGELVCVSWGSVCLSPLLAGSRGLGTSISMLIQGRCGMLNQVLRGNSSPSRREKPHALCGGPARHNKIFSAFLPLLPLLLHLLHLDILTYTEGYLVLMNELGLHIFNTLWWSWWSWWSSAVSSEQEGFNPGWSLSVRS